MEFQSEALGVLIPLVAVVLSLAIPIVAIICGSIISIRKKNRETELRKAIIDNHVDAESIKLLVEEQKPTSNKFIMLRWGCILLGAGLGASISGLSGYDTESFYFWLPVLAGMGCGMLIAFFIENKMSKNEEQEETDEPQAS